MNKLSLILKNKGAILGRNERYLEYIRENNLRNSIRIADDKILTKRVLKKNGIPVPDKLAVIKNLQDLENYNFELLPKSFVIKPVHGVRGSGIEIFYNRDKNGNWIKADGSRWSIDNIKGLCREIIDGKYSLFNEPDIVLIEERIKSHKVFKPYTFKGAPDVRIIVYNKIPIMSYVRIPTKASNGKANLDLGAIGAGIDMAVGKTTNAIIGKSQGIENVPDTNIPLSGLKIPYWDRILRYAIEASRSTELGYGAVDFLIDREKGPVVVELNARPGLSIQIANDDGLRWRLKKAKGLKVKTVERGIRLAKDLFGGEIEEEIEAISGRKVIGLKEEVSFISKDGTYKEKVVAKVDTGADSTSIDTELARRLGYGDAIDYSDRIIGDFYAHLENKDQVREEARRLEINQKLEQHPDIVSTAIVSSSSGVNYRIKIKVNVIIDEILIETEANIFERSYLSHQVILGRKSLSKFLIDPSRR